MDFKDWLPKQAKREDAVGELARYVASAEEFPMSPVRRDLKFALSARLKGELSDGVDAAVSEWEQAVADERTAANVAETVAAAQKVAEAEAKEAAAREKEAAERAARVVPDARAIKRQEQELADARTEARTNESAAEVSEAAEPEPAKKAPSKPRKFKKVAKEAA